MDGLPEASDACNGHAVVVDRASDGVGGAISGALRGIGLLHVDRLAVPGTGQWPAGGRWALGVVTPDAAAVLGAADLDWLMDHCACVHVDEVAELPGVAGRRLGLERADRSAPSQARICPGPVAEALQELLSGYVDPSRVVLEPIKYDGRECVADLPADRSGTVKPVPGAVAWMSHAQGSGEDCVVSREGLLVSRLPLLRALVDGFRVAECGAPVRAFGGGRNREVLEIGLLHIWASIAAAQGAPLITREPWPEGVPQVLSLRLDYDRPVDDVRWGAFRSWQRQIGLRASWYFLGTTVDPGRIAALVSEGDEVGLHYRRVEVHGDRDLGILSRTVADAGGALSGATCHGGNYQAARDLRWLEKAGLGYSEQLGRCSWHPYHGLMPDGS